MVHAHALFQLAEDAADGSIDHHHPARPGRIRGNGHAAEEPAAGDDAPARAPSPSRSIDPDIPTLTNAAPGAGVASLAPVVGAAAMPLLLGRAAPGWGEPAGLAGLVPVPEAPPPRRTLAG